MRIILNVRINEVILNIYVKSISVKFEKGRLGNQCHD
jgi:hypothetical protein